MNYRPKYRLRIDLHCHSRASDNPPLWFMQRLGCPESFTIPEDLRKIALQRDMDFVTLTDHDTINGVQEILHYDNVFMGCEVTTFFPNTDIKVHVLVYDFTAAQFQRINQVRHNIFELVEYLNQHSILHICAHPLHKVNGKLTWDYFEKLILLFKHFETLNGSRLHELNHTTERVLRSLTPEKIDELALKHNLQPVGEEPWVKFFTAGTDDHSGLFVGTCYTEVWAEQPTLQGVLEAIRNGYTSIGGASDGCLTLSHQVNSIAYQYYRNRVDRDSRDVIMGLGRIFERTRHQLSGPQSGLRKAMKKVLKVFRKPKGTGIDLIDEIQEVLSSNKSLKSLFQEGVMTREEFNDNVLSLTADVLDEMIVRVSQKPRFLPWFLAFAPLVSGSYIMCAKNLHDEKDLIRRAKDWLGEPRRNRVGWFTDSVANMDGVSKTCRAFLHAGMKRDKDLTLVTCTDEPVETLGNVKNFAPVKKFPVPGYEKVPLGLPSLLRVLKYVEEAQFDSIVVSTPGPVGLMGLLCGKLMHIPVYGIYHTDLPRIAMQVSGDPMFGEVALMLTRKFYAQVEGVLAPSQWYKNDLVSLDVPAERIGIMERWVDADVFSPKHRDEHYWDAPEPIKLLYVGRISKDKNLDLLLRLYRELAAKHPHFVIHIVGDGPYAEEMRTVSAQWSRFHMVGARFGEELSRAYASSDLFVYPGLLDTFGNVVIEAQASGLPCVVMNEGGPPELVSPGETGLIGHTAEEFIQHVDNLLADEPRRRQMATRASQYARDRFAEETVFNDFWQQVTVVPDMPIEDKKTFQFEQIRQPQNLKTLSA